VVLAGILLVIFITIIASLTLVWLIFDLISRLQSLFGGAPWVPLEDDVAAAMWEATSPQSGEVVIDLGCGDARHIIAAVSKYPVTAIGVEVAFIPLLRARLAVGQRGLADKVKIIRQDLRRARVEDADIIFLYLFPRLLQLFVRELMPRLRPGTRIVTARFPLPSEFVPAQKLTNARHPIYLYRISG
jgi:hypothetical protein